MWRNIFALIFFVLCGVSILSSFNTLLMLFVGIEILSIPLYILTGSDKRDLKSNEASLKYFLMGRFFQRTDVAWHRIPSTAQAKKEHFLSMNSPSVKQLLRHCFYCRPNFIDRLHVI